MLNTLDDYIPNSVPLHEDFCTHGQLVKKVGPDGVLLPYPGNTAVFLLGEHERGLLAGLREELYAAAGPMLAERLRDESFHMTLHGLEDGVPGTPGLAERMSAAAALARPILARHRQGPALRMRATRLFNMLHTSVVLCLAPADGDSYARLDAMYLELEEVKRLGYALTPHITMAYYRPGRYSAAQAARLASALRPVELELSLAMEDLVLQDFTDMNRYTTVF